LETKIKNEIYLNGENEETDAVQFDKRLFTLNILIIPIV